MSKFKVGDKVRILDGSKINDYRGDWTSDMNNYIGKVCTIRKASEDKPTGYWMKEIDYIWDERGLERIEDKLKNQKIVITHDGKMTTAKFYDGKQVIKAAKAKCSPSDEFDFNVGASIALARLTGQTENTIEEGLDFDEFLDAITCIEKFLRQLND